MWERGSGGEEKIPAATVEAACAIGEYATAHARAAFGAMGAGSDPAVDDARYLLGVIASLGKPAVAKRELWRATRARFGRVQPLEAALALLVEHGYLRQQPPAGRLTPNPTPGRKPGPVYLLNPLYTPRSASSRLP